MFFYRIIFTYGFMQIILARINYIYKINSKNLNNKILFVQLMFYIINFHLFYNVKIL